MRGKAAGGLLAFTLLLILPLLLVMFSGNPRLSLPLIPVGIIVLYSSAHLANIASSPAQNIVTATFWLFTYIFLGIAPFLQLTTNTFPWAGSYDASILVKSAFIVLSGLLAFDCGLYLMPKKGAGAPRILQRPLNKTAITMMTFISLASSPYFLSRIGGGAMLFAPRLERGQALMTDTELPEMMLLIQGLSTPAYVLLIASLAIWVGRRVRGGDVRIGWKMMTFILLLTTLVLNNPISTARLKVGTILLSLFFSLPWRRWSGAATVAGLVFALLVVFPFADLFRNSLDARLSERLAGSSAIGELTENGDFDAFQMIANATSTLERREFQLGRQLGGALLFWVPRSIWPNKPIATGQWVAEKEGYDFTNLSSPLWVEFYVDGGWLLIIAGFFGYGYLVRTIDRWHAVARNNGETQVVSILVPIYAGYQFFLLRGALMPALAYFAPILLVALMCSARIGRRRIRIARTAFAPGASATRKAHLKLAVRSHDRTDQLPSKS